MRDEVWLRVLELLLELDSIDFCVFGQTDEGAEIVERLIAIATESLS